MKISTDGVSEPGVPHIGDIVAMKDNPRFKTRWMVISVDDKPYLIPMNHRKNPVNIYDKKTISKLIGSRSTFSVSMRILSSDFYIVSSVKLEQMERSSIPPITKYIELVSSATHDNSE